MDACVCQSRGKKLFLRSVSIPPDKWLATDLSHVKKMERRISASDFMLVPLFFPLEPPIQPSPPPIQPPNTLKTKLRLNRRQVDPPFPPSTLSLPLSLTWQRRKSLISRSSFCTEISGHSSTGSRFQDVIKRRKEKKGRMCNKSADEGRRWSNEVLCWNSALSRCWIMEGKWLGESSSSVACPKRGSDRFSCDCISLRLARYIRRCYLIR